MIKPELYETLANGYGVTIAVATGFGEAIEGASKEMVEGAEANRIICEAIQSGRYRQLQKELWKRRGGRQKEINRYKTAWKQVKNETKSKSG